MKTKQELAAYGLTPAEVQRWAEMSSHSAGRAAGEVLGGQPVYQGDEEVRYSLGYAANQAYYWGTREGLDLVTLAAVWGYLRAYEDALTKQNT